MIKVETLQILVISVVTGFLTIALAIPCTYPDEMWTYPDPTRFYFCNINTNEAIVGKCPDNNSGFLRNSSVAGCVPWKDWPNECVNKDPVGTCTGKNIHQPFAGSVPTEFYMCKKENEDPIQLNCKGGYAFIHKDGWLGCVKWELWRKLTGCIS